MRTKCAILENLNDFWEFESQETEKQDIYGSVRIHISINLPLNSIYPSTEKLLGLPYEELAKSTTQATHQELTPISSASGRSTSLQ